MIHLANQIVAWLRTCGVLTRATCWGAWDLDAEHWNLDGAGKDPVAGPEDLKMIHGGKVLDNLKTFEGHQSLQLWSPVHSVLVTKCQQALRNDRRESATR